MDDCAEAEIATEEEVAVLASGKRDHHMPCTLNSVDPNLQSAYHMSLALLWLPCELFVVSPVFQSAKTFCGEGSWEEPAFLLLHILVLDSCWQLPSV